MGKSKKLRLKANVTSPTGLLDSKKFEQEFTTTDRRSIINNIETSLQQGGDSEMDALQQLSTLCYNEVFIKAILNSDIVRITAPLLVHPDQAIRNSAAGALRNLSAISVEICENLVEQDLLTPLVSLIQQYSLEWVPAIDKKTNELNLQSDTFLQAVNIVGNLCESTSIALDTFNQSNLLENFVRCLNFEVFGLEISISIGQCLLVISEDNATSWKFLAQHNQFLAELLNLEVKSQQHVLLRTLVAAIMANVPALLMPNFNKILTVLSKTIEIDQKKVLVALAGKLIENGQGEGTEAEFEDIEGGEEMEVETEEDGTATTKKKEKVDELELEVKQTGNLLSAQRTAIEVLSNICIPEEEDVDETMEDSESESVHDYDVSSSQNGNFENMDSLPVEVLEAIKSMGIVEKLWNQSQSLPENITQTFSTTSKDLFKRQRLLRISALLCLHNLCTVMSTEDLGGSESLYGVWIDLGHQLFQQHMDNDLVEAITALMRATLDHLKKNKELFQQMTAEDLKLILNGMKNCKVAEIQVNWVKMLGTLGCLLPEILVKEIIEFLMNASLEEDDLWILSESLDSFMDIFSDSDWNEIVAQLNVIQNFRKLEKKLKTKMKQQKRELIQQKRFASMTTVKTNAARFCKYLESQQKKFLSTK